MIWIDMEDVDEFGHCVLACHEFALPLRRLSAMSRNHLKHCSAMFCQSRDYSDYRSEAKKHVGKMESLDNSQKDVKKA